MNLCHISSHYAPAFLSNRRGAGTGIGFCHYSAVSLKDTRQKEEMESLISLIWTGMEYSCFERLLLVEDSQGLLQTKLYTLDVQAVLSLNLYFLKEE